MSQFLITVYYELTQPLASVSLDSTDRESRPSTNTERVSESEVCPQVSPTNSGHVGHVGHDNLVSLPWPVQARRVL